MPVPVVELLEAVEVDHADAERPACPRRVADGPSQRLVPGAPVGEAGQLVRVGQVAETSEEVGTLDRNGGLDREELDHLERDVGHPVHVTVPADAQHADRCPSAQDRFEQHRDGTRPLDRVLRKRRIDERVGDEVPRSRGERSGAARRLLGQRQTRSTRVGAGPTRHDEIARVEVRFVDHGHRRPRDLERRGADVLAGIGLDGQRTPDVGDRRDRRLVVAGCAGLPSLVTHEGLDRERDDDGRGRPQQSPPPVLGAILLRIADEERQHDHRGADADCERHLAPPEVEGDPDDGEEQERGIARGGAVVRLAQQRDDDEVREGWDDVRPARHRRPRDEKAGRGDRHRECACYPDVRPVGRAGRNEWREQRQKAERRERSEAACDLRLERSCLGPHERPNRQRPHGP